MANELELKYGCNPNQKPARIFIKEGELPIEVLNGRPGLRTRRVRGSDRRAPERKDGACA